MEGNGYLLPLRNSRRYTPYEFDIKMSQNEERMSRLGKIIDQDIFYSLMSQRKTPSVTTGPNYVVENKKEYIPLNKNLKINNYNLKTEITPKNNLMEVSSNSFKIPRSPRYDNINQKQQIREQEQQMMNNDRRFGNNNNQNERFMDEPINNYRNRNNNNNNINDFDEYNNENNYPRMMNNERNNSRNNMRFNDFNNNDMMNGNNRYNDFEEPRRYNNNNFRSQEISKTNNYDIPKSPMNYDNNEGPFVNYRYKNSFRERMNDIDLNDITIKNRENDYNQNNQRYGRIGNNRRGFYNSQLNFPPKEEEY